jgi:hypothetical protein
MDNPLMDTSGINLEALSTNSPLSILPNVESFTPNEGVKG